MADFRYITTALYQNGSTPNSVICELPLTNVSFDTQLNSIGSFTGEILLSGVDYTKLNIYNGTNPGQTCLYVDYGGTIIWGGIIWAREYDSQSQILKITGQEMLSYFTRRKITPLNNSTTYGNASTSGNISYSNVDVCTVANDLIVNYAQNVTFPSQGGTVKGNIGLQGSSHTSGYNITRTYFDFELKEVFQAVKDLSDGLDASLQVPFFDFYINYTYDSSGRPVKHFQMANPYATAINPTTVFQFPGNLVMYSYNQDASNTANALWGLGYGKNSSKIIALALDNNYSFGGSINSTNGNAAILEDTANFIDIEDNTLLQATTLGQLNARSGITIGSSPVITAPEVLQVVIPPYVDPYLTTYNAGDFARVIIIDDLFPSGYDTVNWRIVSITVDPGEDKESRVTVTLSRAIYNLGQSYLVTQ
jgi:hypothetical protein